jgi:uncharacterized protein (DUF1501 family)
MQPTRREFIKNGLTFVSLGMAAPAVLAQAAEGAKSASGGKGGNGKILVVLQMSGGNDGLNTVIPYTDDLYYKARPTIGIARADMVPISDKIALNPGLASLKPLFEKGHVAIIQGAGYPNPNRSHFRSMEIWQTADPAATIAGEGWLGRYFDDDGHLRENPLAGINFGGELPRTLYADYGSVVSMQSPQSFQLQPIAGPEREAEIKAFTDLYATGTMASSHADLIRKVGLDAYTCSEKIKRALAAKPGEGPELGTPSGSTLDAPPVAYPMGAGRGSLLAGNLRTVAQLIGADLGTQIFYVSAGGFDTHANQPRNHANLLKDVADSIAAFYADLEQRGRANDVALVVFSEFGRRVQENASQGTDHGAAGVMFVVGGAVRGGFYGQYPALDDLNQGDLKFNVDFRQVYATLLDQWLGTSSSKILKGRFEHLAFLG